LALLLLTGLPAVALSLARTGTAAGDPVIAAAGDIACDPASGNFNGGLGTSSSCRQRYTSDLLVGLAPAAVLTLGDNQYEDATYTKYLQSFDPSWGRLKPLIRPGVGNHEYLTGGAAGYFQYFGAAAGDPAKGYYSFDVGAWHLVALNSNCSQAGGCGSGSPQEAWLHADLAAHPTGCTLAYWHHPRWSSGQHGSSASYDAFWRDLYSAGVELVLNGHDHDYERFAPQNPAGAADPLGIREFVVGTGGKNHTAFVNVQPNSQVRNESSYGVLKLTLHTSRYDWQFLPEAGQTFTDNGSNTCHGAGTAPSAVVLRHFAARWTGRGVELRWRTAGEAGLLGFEVYRSGSKVNRVLVAARGGAAGASYRLVDRSVSAQQTYAYRLDAVHADGTRTRLARAIAAADCHSVTSASTHSGSCR
jgi:hypothetical protein